MTAAIWKDHADAASVALRLDNETKDLGYLENLVKHVT